MLTVLAVATVFYVLVQGAVGSLHLQGHPRPLQEAVASVPALAWLVSATALFLVLGVNASIAFTAPRSLWALARDGEIPAWLAPLHPTLGTPVRCIAVHGVLTALLVLAVPFRTLALLVVMASLLQYIPTLAAMLALRLREPARERPFTAPAGKALATLGLLVCVFLLSQARVSDLVSTGGALALGAGLYALRPRRASS